MLGRGNLPRGVRMQGGESRGPVQALGGVANDQRPLPIGPQSAGAFGLRLVDDGVGGSYGRGWLTGLAKAYDEARARHQSRQDDDPHKHICPVTAQMLHDGQGSQVQRWTAGDSYRLNTSDLHPIYFG